MLSHVGVTARHITALQFNCQGTVWWLLLQRTCLCFTGTERTTSRGPRRSAPLLRAVTMRDGHTPVRLVLNLGEKPREPRVVKATKRHLVCEYDGLVFKQPREDPPAENVPLNRSGQQPTPAGKQQQQQQSRERRASGTPAPPAHATPATQRRAAPPQPNEPLEALCAGWLQAEAEQALAGGSAEVAATLQDICQRLCAGGALLGEAAQPLHHGSRTPVVVAARVEEEVEQADYQMDLEARKAGLRARLQGYQQEIADWERLVEEAEQYSSEPGEAALEVATPESDATEPADVAELKKMHTDLHRHLTMQADGLCKLVGDMEELVERANRTAHSLQAEYHQEKFRAFPHVDSPARLIKEIIKPPVKRAAAPQQ